jgi:predicted metal-dependent hydrolase
MIRNQKNTSKPTKKMDIKIKYSKVKHWRARIWDNWNLSLTIPLSMKNNKAFQDSLLEKWKMLLEKHKTNNANKINFITEKYFFLFWKKVNRETVNWNLDLFLKKELLTSSIKLADYYTNKLWVNYNKISVKRLKSKRWSCSSNKNISLNLYLIHLPEKFLNYVIIHEVCHLLEMNHSKIFWSLVEKLCPDYKKIRKEMKKIKIN